MTDTGVLPRRAFLRLASGAGLALAAMAVAACDTARPTSGGLPTGTPAATPGPSASASASSVETAGPTPSTAPASTSPTPTSTVPGPTPTPGPSVAEENRFRGAAGWARGLGAASPAALWASPSSVEPGDVISLHVRCRVPYAIEWYRIGWYEGAGARLVHREPARPAAQGGAVRRDPLTGLVETHWPVTDSATVTDAWRSGVYVAVVRPTDGSAPRATPFVVRAPLRSPAATVFVSAQATWQAYNGWGGKSLYSYNSRGLVTASGTRAAAVVSMDRPYEADGGLGYLRKWEVQFIRWMERTGRDVDYVLDLDLETRPEVLVGRRFVVFAGHAEYWSRPMREAIEGTVASGTNAAFFSANEIYWQVRLGSTGNGPDRRITCYKSAKHDPVRLTDPELTTCRWREAPVLQPEARFLGVMYGHVVQRPADWIVHNAGHWLYDGTGLLDGEAIVNLVGQEYDAYFRKLAPAGTVVVAMSPVPFVGRDPDQFGDVASPAMQSAAIRDPARGAGGVFGAGTFQWSWALDEYAQHEYAGVFTPTDRRVERMTANVWDRWSV